MLSFQLYAFIGSWPRCYALAYAGYLPGEHWQNDPWLRAVMHQLDVTIISVLVLGLVWFVVRHLRHRP